MNDFHFFTKKDCITVTHTERNRYSSIDEQKLRARTEGMAKTIEALLNNPKNIEVMSKAADRLSQKITALPKFKGN